MEKITLRQLAARVALKDADPLTHSDVVDRLLEAWKRNPGSAERWARELRVEIINTERKES